MELDYLFTAIYEDGTTLKQTQEDISTKDQRRSAYYDIDHEKLIAFGLENEKDAVLVDLRDGAFQINGMTFSLCDEDITNRRLIYFRRHLQSFNQNEQEVGHEIKYHIGWQGNDSSGKNVKRIIIL
jgi:hypothetical protein